MEKSEIGVWKETGIIITKYCELQTRYSTGGYNHVFGVFSLMDERKKDMRRFLKG